MSEYQEIVKEARKKFTNLNFEQERELYKIYKDAGNNLINEILQMPDSRTKSHRIETYKIISDYKSELYNNLSKTIENNIQKSSDIQKEVQLSFVDMISPDKVTNEALKRTITKVSNDTVKQLIAGGYYKDGKTLSKRIWNLTGDNGNKIDAIIKDNISKGANGKELAKELDKYVNPKNRITPKTFTDGLGGDNISYQARRLARTSITHAQTETMIQNAKKNPFCKGLKWNLSASHFTRMHGKRDICDDYEGRTFKPEELPLQHPNCLCYFTEVLEDMNKCIETMKDWGNGKKNKAIDDWVQEGNDKTSINVTAPKNIQTEMNVDTSDENNDIIRENDKPTESNTFIKAKNIKEVETRISSSLGANDVNLGRMNIDLGNQYLEGIELFANDYPELKGFLNSMNTETHPDEYGHFGVSAQRFIKGTKVKYDFSTELSLLSPRNVAKMMSQYENDIKNGFHYENMSPKLAAIHECTHAIDTMLLMHDRGAYLEGKFVRVRAAKGLQYYCFGYSDEIINKAKKEIFGKTFGDKVSEGTKYLGKYALTSTNEMLAQCISYEYSGKTNKFSAKVKELFDKKIKEVFK